MSERLFDLEPITIQPTLRDRFVVPPFSVLDTRQGYWQERRRQWLRMGIRSELGRGENLLYDSEQIASDFDYYRHGKGPGPGVRPKGLLSQATPRAGMDGNWNIENGENAWGGAGTSIFDPVLCEIAYRWFSPHGGSVLDPFAGGSVRGIVSSALERIYVGVDLSGAQIAANIANADEIKITPKPTWITGDSRNIRALAPGEYDFLFTCPPYADLEVYSDDPADISTLGYSDFIEAYRHILAESLRLLKDDRFAIIVVSEVREERRGCYRGLVPDTIRSMQDCGAQLWNEAILINRVGTLALRVSRNFSPNRKLGRGHQNVLVFCKGSGRRAAEACGEIRNDYDYDQV